MDNKGDRTPNRCGEIRAIIKEIDDFIVSNDWYNVLRDSRKNYYWGYILHLTRLYNAGQILIQRGGDGKITGICSWVRCTRDSQLEINKTTFGLPKDISNGSMLHITICVINGGSIGTFRRNFVETVGKEVEEVCWFNAPTNKFIRRKNILKEKCYARN